MDEFGRFVDFDLQAYRFIWFLTWDRCRAVVVGNGVSVLSVFVESVWLVGIWSWEER